MVSNRPQPPDNALAAAISKIGEPDLAATLLDAIRGRCNFDSSLVLLYSQHRRPDILADRLSHARRENNAEHYCSGAYLLDPFYTWSRDLAEPALCRMGDIAAKDFDTSEYFISYYKQSGVVDEINYLVPLPDGRVFAISIERSAMFEAFSDSEMVNFQALLPVVAAIVAKHVEIPGVELPDNDTDPEHERLESILRNFHADILTPRESEVVQLMLNGYSAPSIAGLLEVSVETVRVHRRNIYEKLSISSLAQLFALALKAIYAQRVRGAAPR